MQALPLWESNRGIWSQVAEEKDVQETEADIGGWSEDS